MKVRTRLLLFGAALPVLGTLGAVLLAGQLFYLSLVRALDHSLHELAAVESVSLFDGPNGYPHLPMPPAAPPPRALPQGVLAVYEVGGGPFLRIPADARVPTQAPSVSQGDPVTSVALGGAPTRELCTLVVARDGHPFVLWLAAPLGVVRATTATFFQITLAVWMVMSLALLAVQLWQARLLARRVSAMAAFLPRLREGDFTRTLPPDPTGDEIAALRDALTEASRQLKAARDRQERLIANAAHEVQTPLACMRTLIDLALIRERSASELREALKESRDEIDRLGALARNLMDLAAAGQVMMEERELDLVALGHASVEAFRAQAAARSLAIEQLPSEPQLVRGDPVALRQAADNLVSNALKFAPPGSTVSTSFIVSANGRVRFVVRDRGTGVPAGDEEKIFEPFYRSRVRPAEAGEGAAARSENPGAGLGLPLAREIARRFGGDVKLAPRDARPEGLMGDSPPEGACFFLELPLAKAAASESAPHSGVFHPPTSAVSASASAGPHVPGS